MLTAWIIYIDFGSSSEPRESKQDRIEEHTCRQALSPLDSFVVFQVLVFRVNVAEEANSNTRSGKSSHSSDDFPEFEAAAAADRRAAAP